MLNGFADRGEIERMRAGLASEFGVSVGFSDAHVQTEQVLHQRERKPRVGMGHPHE